MMIFTIFTMSAAFTSPSPLVSPTLPPVAEITECLTHCEYGTRYGVSIIPLAYFNEKTSRVYRLMVHLCFYFAAVNNYVEPQKYKIMAGLFLMFVMAIALGSLADGYVDVLNHVDETH